MAKKRFILSGGFGSCTVEDYTQAGFLALVGAVNDYDPEKGFEFTTFLHYHVKTEFANAAGIRSTKRDALLFADSLDVPINDDKPDGETRLDSLKDPSDQFESVEQKIWLEELHTAIETALRMLSADQGDLIRRRYYDGCTLNDLASERGVSSETIRQREEIALQKLKRLSKKSGLEKFVDRQTQFYKTVSVEQFNTTHSSAVEELLFRRENLRKQYRDPHREGRSKFAAKRR